MCPERLQHGDTALRKCGSTITDSIRWPSLFKFIARFRIPRCVGACSSNGSILMAVQATVIIPKAVRSSFRRDSDDEDSDLEHDLRIEEDQIYVLGNASRQKARVQRSAQLAKQAKLAGAPWAKELASFLASEEDLRENTSDTLKAYGHSRHEAEAGTLGRTVWPADV